MRNADLVRHSMLGGWAASCRESWRRRGGRLCDRCIAKLEKKFSMSIDDAYDSGKLSFYNDDLCLPWVQYQITGDIGKMWLCAEDYDLLSVNPAALHDPDQHRSTP